MRYTIDGDISLQASACFTHRVSAGSATRAMGASCVALTAGDGYSLEEARKKREEDKLLATADAKKRGVRAYVQELRKYAPARLYIIIEYTV